MFNYQKHEIVSLAKENGFRSETLEKVLRLIDILDYINKNDELSPYLVLKGGTSINFTIFNFYSSKFYHFVALFKMKPCGF